MAESVKMSRLRGIIVSVRLVLILVVEQASLLSVKNTEFTSICLLRTALTNVDGAHTKIVLVHLADSSVTNLVDGEELWHPSLWIQGKTKALSSSSVSIGCSEVSSSSGDVSSSSRKSSSSSEVFSSSGKSSSSSVKSSSSEEIVSSSSSSRNGDEASSSSSENLVEKFVLDEDSAGFYVKTNEFQEAHWSYKMELVWTYMDPGRCRYFWLFQAASWCYSGLVQ